MALGIFSVSLLSAQTGAGSIQGTVSDPTGAVIPNADITLNNIDTNNILKTKSNSAGFFLFPTVQPSHYRISAEAAGMEKWEGQLQLLSGQQAVLSPVLAVGGAVNTKITVAGDITPVLTTTSAELSSVVERARIEQLPLNGRDFQNLLTVTTPGLESGEKGNGTPQAYGLRDQTVDFVLDGVSIKDANTGAVTVRPGLDTIQEYRLEMSVPPARYNSAVTAVLTTRSGTNEWHGSAFETARNNGFGFARQRQDFSAKPPQYIRNEFGASLGGPVRIPRLYNGKDRTFFFVAWEGLRLRSATTMSTSLPTQAEQQGIFTGLTNSSGQAETLYNPYTTGPAPNYVRLPYPNNVIPKSQESPFAAFYYSQMPQPNQPNINPAISANYFGPDPTLQNESTFTVRVDHRFSDKDQVYWRYSLGNHFLANRRTSSTTAPISLNDYWNYQEEAEKPQSLSFSWNHIFGASFFVETVVTAAHLNWQFDQGGLIPTTNVAASLGVPNPFGLAGAPTLASMGFSITGTGTIPRADNNNPITVEQNYTRVFGKHQLEFGWRFQRLILDVIPDGPGEASISFGSLATSLYDPATGSAYGAVTRSGDNLANFFLGVATSYTQTQPAPQVYLRSNNASGYFQDNWKIRRDLTLNLGLRYDFLQPLQDLHGTTAVFDFKNDAIVREATVSQLIANGATTQAFVNQYQAIGVKFETPQQAGWNNLQNVGQLNFSPRVGFAYSPKIFKHTYVIRGGYGDYRYNLAARQNNSAALRSVPPLQGNVSYNISSAAQSPDGIVNYGLRSVPTVIAGTPSAVNVINPSAATAIARGVALNVLGHDFPTTVAREWNLTFETEVIKNTLLRVAYIGTAGRNLDGSILYNGQPNNLTYYTTTGLALPTGTFASVALRDYDKTTYGNIQVAANNGYTNFNGAQVEVQRHFNGGLAFQWFYVMSNAMWTGSGGTIESSSTVLPDPVTFLPGSVPTDQAAYQRFYQYSRDPYIPKHRVTWNALYELPIGRGKRFLSSAGPLLDKIVGGWQVAAYSQMNSNYITLPSNNWGKFSNVTVYGKKYPVQDCRSGTCIKGYLWYNGYIPANQINTKNASGVCTGVCGVPTDYVPSEQPIYPIPANPNPSDPNFALYGTNQVTIPLKNGSTVKISYDNGLNPYRNQVIPGPWSFTVNSSAFKVVSIGERVKLRFNLDAFNLFNQPGTPLPDANTGIISLQNSSNAARQLQMSLRLNF